MERTYVRCYEVHGEDWIEGFVLVNIGLLTLPALLLLEGGEGESMLLPDFCVVHAEVAGAGNIALSAPDFQQDLIPSRLPAKSDRVAEAAHRLAVDFQNNVTALQSGVGGI